MKGGIFLAILFILLHVLEQSVFHVFSGVIANIPLLVIAGIIVMQRIGPEEGAVWFLLLAFLSGFDLYPFFWMILGPLFLSRVFTTRSVYALIGFGAVTHACASIFSLIVEKSLHRFFLLSFIPIYHLESLLFQTLFIVIGLFVGITLVRFVERHAFFRFYFQRP